MDMSQFLQTFFEESAEGLEVMEAGLLELDEGSTDSDVINSIFRAAHSIKGGSATFGLSEVAEFTHLMETLLDEMRDGRRRVEHDSVDVLFSSLDVVKHLMDAAQNHEDCDKRKVSEVEDRLKQILGNKADAVAGSGSVNANDAEAISGWSIRFKPNENLYMTGNDPFRILLELRELAQVSCQMHCSPDAEFISYDPESSYLWWELNLNGDVSRQQLDDVFAWVEDDCELVIETLGGNEVDSNVAVAEGKEHAELDDVGEEKRQGERRMSDRRSDERRGGSSDTGTIRVSVDKVDAVINLVGELVITQSMLNNLGENFNIEQLNELRDGLSVLERNTRELQEDVMRMRMLPISFVFNRFPRLVRDLSQKLGKKVILEMSGEGTEVDKNVIEKLADPLVHLIRNSMDHGIEVDAQSRIDAGKDEVGVINLNAYHKGGNIVLEVKDDGRGLNAEKIRNKAIEKGVIKEDDILAEGEIFELIMRPGFSTADEVSDVSGRGVGMDVVRKNIQSLGGNIEVTSIPGKGSCFTVRLPLTLAILDGQTISIGPQNYIIPLVSIVESLQVRTGDFRLVNGKGETYKLREEYIPVVRLEHVFNTRSDSQDDEERLLVVVESEGRRIALMVDALHSQQQVVIKSIDRNYGKVDGVSGATILGDGKVALILDINGVLNMYRNRTEMMAA